MSSLALFPSRLSMMFPFHYPLPIHLSPPRTDSSSFSSPRVNIRSCTFPTIFIFSVTFLPAGSNFSCLDFETFSLLFNNRFRHSYLNDSDTLISTILTLLSQRFRHSYLNDYDTFLPADSDTLSSAFPVRFLYFFL